MRKQRGLRGGQRSVVASCAWRKRDVGTLQGGMRRSIVEEELLLPADVL